MSSALSPPSLIGFIYSRLCEGQITGTQSNEDCSTHTHLQLSHSCLISLLIGFLVPSCPPQDIQSTWLWRKGLLHRLTLVLFEWLNLVYIHHNGSSYVKSPHAHAFLQCCQIMYLPLNNRAIVQHLQYYDSERRTRYRGHAPELYVILITNPSSPYMQRLLGNEFCILFFF